MLVSQVPKDLTAYTLIVNEFVFHQKESSGESFEKTGFDGLVMPKLEELGISTGCLVTVDYHT